MWIPEYKRAKIAKTIVVLAIVMVVLIMFNLIYSRTAKEATDIAMMNKRELHYDADGPFIMIDIKHDLIGFYRATLPVYHNRFKEEIEPGIYTAEFDEYGNTIDIYNGSKVLITSIDVSKDEELQHGFDECPVLVYDDRH